MAQAAIALIVAAALAGGSAAAAQSRLPPNLPIPLTNNAIAAARIDGRLTLFTALGLDSTKRWSGITARAFRWTDGHLRWDELPPVPGPRGRLAATAQFVRGRLFLFGGYTVGEDSGERSVAAVDVLDPKTNAWTSGAPTPVAVDDAVSGVFRDSLVYLVSGWHDTANVALVQIYDVVKNRWVEGSAFPGTPVFGHAGGLVGQSLVVVDGAKRVAGPNRYALERQAWLGRIDGADPTRIQWSRLPDHPGPPRYRAAAGPCPPSAVVIVGGTANPYNYDGIGYDKVPSTPEPGGIAFDVATRRWQSLPRAEVASMDHRGLVVVGRQGWVVGGMRSAQAVAAATVSHQLPICGSTP